MNKYSTIYKLRMENNAQNAVNNGACVWYCDIGDIASIQSPDWKAYMTMLSPTERERVLKYRFDDDKRRALISLLLQRWLVRKKLGIDVDSGYEIRRTPENKPYAYCEDSGNNILPLGFWNYNLSHHGRYVGLVSHATRLVGVDIVDITTRTTMVNTAHAYAMLFKGQLHPEELQSILAQTSETQAYALFFVIWSLKESFIKAVGLGLGYDLQTVQFSVYYLHGATPLSPEVASNVSSDCSSNSSIAGYATVRIDGVERAAYRGGPYRRADDISATADREGWDCNSAPPVPPSSAEIWPQQAHAGLWTFDFFSLDARHVVCVAHGPLQDSLRSYKLLAWRNQELSVDGIPPRERQHIQGEFSTRPELSSEIDRALPQPLHPSRDPHPPSPEGVDAMDAISGENAASLVQAPPLLLASSKTIQAERLSVRSLLPAAQRGLVSAPLPMSPPATDLNNRYDASVLMTEVELNSAVNEEELRAEDKVQIQTVVMSSGNVVDWSRPTVVEMPLSPASQHPLDTFPPISAQGGVRIPFQKQHTNASGSAAVDWKTLELPTRDKGSTDFNSPANWRTGQKLAPALHVALQIDVEEVRMEEGVKMDRELVDGSALAEEQTAFSPADSNACHCVCM